MALTGLQHVSGKKHQKFSNDDENFWQLDDILGRLGRKTLEQVEEEEHTWLSEGLRRLHSESTAMEDDGPHDEQEQEQQEFPDQDDDNREAEEAASERGGSVFDVSGDDDGAMMTPRPHETHDHTEWIDLYDY
jgi:DBF zinc finger